MTSFRPLLLLCAVRSCVTRGIGVAEEPPGATDPAATSTAWRDDVAIVKRLNEFCTRMPFSREFEGVLDDCSLSIEWTVGPNLPVACKGGVAGIIGDEIVLSGGLWMPARVNLAMAFHPQSSKYRELPPPPVRPQYPRGACDGVVLYIIGGRGTGRTVYKLHRGDSGDWSYDELPALPVEEAAGRWLASVAIIPGGWLFLLCYDIDRDSYSHVGVMLHGVATSHRVSDGEQLYSFGGEPGHSYTLNIENVLQIGLMRWKPGQ